MKSSNKKLLLVRWGLVKNNANANLLYFVIIIACFGLTYATLSRGVIQKPMPYSQISPSVKSKLPPDARRILEQQNANVKK